MFGMVFYDFCGSCFRPLVGFSPTFKSLGQKGKQKAFRRPTMAVQKVGRPRCTTHQLRIKMGSRAKEGTKQDDFLILGRRLCRVYRRRLDLLISSLNSVLAFSAPEDLARHCAFLCKTNIEMRTWRHTVAGRRLDIEILETKYISLPNP